MAKDLVLVLFKQRPKIWFWFWFCLSNVQRFGFDDGIGTKTKTNWLKLMAVGCFFKFLFYGAHTCLTSVISGTALLLPATATD